VLIDTLPNALEVDVFLPGATWMEKAGTFENVNGQLQSFHRAVSPARWCKSEAQIATDLLARLRGDTPHAFSDTATREAMAEGGLPEMTRDVQHPPAADVQVDSDMHLIVL
jgi:anaerobic selenocysteine-containing dehydrogenase